MAGATEDTVQRSFLPMNLQINVTEKGSQESRDLMIEEQDSPLLSNSFGHKNDRLAMHQPLVFDETEPLPKHVLKRRSVLQ